MRIIICGINGAGKSTLAKALAQKLRIPSFDIEDFYFNKTVDYKYSNPNSRKEVEHALQKELSNKDNFILAARKGNFEGVDFDVAIHLEIDKNTQYKRLWERSEHLFGARIKPNGDLYSCEKSFINGALSHTDEDIRDWISEMKTVGKTVIELDGSLSIKKNVYNVLAILKE